MSCNCILGNTKSMDDIIKLNLMESYCLPILTYATVAMRLTNVQINELNACWNSMYRRVFNFNKWESIRTFIGGLGRMDFCHLRMLLYLKFCNAGLLCTDDAFCFVMNIHYLSEQFISAYQNVGLKLLHLNKFSNLKYSELRAAVYSCFLES